VIAFVIERQFTNERMRDVRAQPAASCCVVQPNADGGWDVVNPRGKRASAHVDKQADAIDRAREILGNLGGGELEIRNRQGEIRDVDTVPQGNDPNPPRDRR
jgi:hypothetical protein